MKYTLKMLRASKNWSQVTAAEQVGVSVDTWGNWERKRSFPDVLHIKRYKKCLMWHMTTLFFYSVLRFNRYGKEGRK